MDEIPNITLAGRSFPIPRLAIKQLRIVVPGIFELQKILPNPGANIDLSDAAFNLLCKVVFVGMSAGSPGFTQQQFDDLPAAPTELLDALGVISGQTGMVKAASNEGAASAEGEGKATA